MRLAKVVIPILICTLFGTLGIKNISYAAEATETDAVMESKEDAILTEPDSAPGPVNAVDTASELGTNAGDDDKTGKTAAITVYEGVDYAPVYDYDFYLQRYADIRNAFNGDQELTLQHFVRYGMKEKRQAAESFNVTSYMNKYQDLRNVFGDDTVKYFLHFINYGNKEGRKAVGTDTLQNPTTVYGGVDYSDVYDYYYYVDHNPDVKNAFARKNAPDQYVLKHFISYGVNEKRQASDSFDIKSYVNAYADLRRAFGTDWSKYLTHYEKYGKKESRKTTGVNTMVGCLTSDGTTDYKDVYDYNYYTGKYADLRRVFAYDDAGALNHFIKYGMKEGRQGKESFEVASYYNAYQDLRVAFGKDWAKYYNHYIKYGKKEGRVSNNVKTLQNPIKKLAYADFSEIYDYYYYINKYPDIYKAFKGDEVATLTHFARYGLKEGRTAKADYNKSEYNSKKTLMSYLYKPEYKNGWLKFDPTFKTGYADASNLEAWKAYDEAAFFYRYDATGNIVEVRKDAPALVEMPGFYISPMYTGNLNSSAERIEAMIRRAYDYYGDRYTGNTSAEPKKRGVDCSGLTMQCLYAAGFDPYPATPKRHVYTDYCSRVLWEEHPMQHISIKNNDYSGLKRGDLVYQKGRYTTLVTHVAMYLGNGRVIESWPGDGVTDKLGIIHKIQPHDLKGATRPFP